MIIDLNVKHNTVNLLEDNIGESKGDLGFGNDFLGTVIPKAQPMKKNDKLVFVKTKNF